MSTGISSTLITLQEIVTGPETAQSVMKVETKPEWAAVGAFDEALAKLQKLYESEPQQVAQGSGVEFRVMNAEELALAMMKSDLDSPFSYGCFVPNDHIYQVGKDTLIVDGRHSLIFRNAKRATKANNAGREFKVEESAYDELMQLSSTDASEARKTGVLRVVATGSHDYRFPTDAFGQLNVPVFIFGEKTASDYGRWLKEEARLDIMVSFAGYISNAEQKGPFVQALHVSHPGSAWKQLKSSESFKYFLSFKNGSSCAVLLSCSPNLGYSDSQVRAVRVTRTEA